MFNLLLYHFFGWFMTHFVFCFVLMTTQVVNCAFADSKFTYRLSSLLECVLRWKVMSKDVNGERRRAITITLPAATQLKPRGSDAFHGSANNSRRDLSLQDVSHSQFAHTWLKSSLHALLSNILSAHVCVWVPRVLRPTSLELVAHAEHYDFSITNSKNRRARHAQYMRVYKNPCVGHTVVFTYASGHNLKPVMGIRRSPSCSSMARARYLSIDMKSSTIS